MIACKNGAQQHRKDHHMMNMPHMIVSFCIYKEKKTVTLHRLRDVCWLFLHCLTHDYLRNRCGKNSDSQTRKSRVILLIKIGTNNKRLQIILIVSCWYRVKAESNIWWKSDKKLTLMIKKKIMYSKPGKLNIQGKKSPLFSCSIFLSTKTLQYNIQEHGDKNTRVAIEFTSTNVIYFLLESEYHIL